VTDAATPARPRLSEAEFVALMAMLAATVAFSIDAMLPALPRIGAELSPGAPNAAQLVVIAFVLGMGLATFVVGPLSDAFGRKPVMLAGAALYCAGAAWGALSGDLASLLAARLVQGMGAAGPRVVAQAMIRDLYAGRGMARITSFVMAVFTLVPAVAPLMGAAIIAATDWHGVFWSFVVFSLASAVWLALRQPETLPPEARRPLRPRGLLLRAREVLAHPVVRRAALVQAMVFGGLFATIASVQQVYETTFDKAASFPLWFGGVALIAGTASFLNARLVMRLGMLVLLRRALAAQVALSLAVAGAWAAGLLPEAARFPAFLAWQVGSFALAGLTIGNVQAIAMEPMGHQAGMAASVISAVATVLAVCVAAPIGLAFDGTPLPLMLGVGAILALALWLSRGLREGG
jgi:DHA1 family bicyclomycin/chloramphenicol resistance-like MFS transporter